MGYDDGFFYGQGKLVCTSTTSADNGKTVSVVSSGGTSYSGTMADQKCEFTVPGKDKYTVSLIDNGTTQYTTEVIFGYGDYIELPVGMDPTTPAGIKAIINAGLEASFFTAGDQIAVGEGGTDVLYDVVEVGYKTGTYGHNIVLERHDCLASTRQMNTSNTNAGGYQSSVLATYLDGTFFSDLDSDWQDVISEMTYYASVGSQSTNLQAETHKIWLPLEYNIFGATTYAAGTEVTSGNAEQFAYFATSGNRVKTVNGANSYWWLSSPAVSASASFCFVDASGAANYSGASASFGVAPCFMIAAD